MRKILLFAVVVIIFIVLLMANCFAENFAKSNLTSDSNSVKIPKENLIKFTETQKKTLEAMVMGAQVAQNRIKEFVDYLVAEHKVDQSYRISKDLSGFEKIPQPKVEEVKK